MYVCMYVCSVSGILGGRGRGFLTRYVQLYLGGEFKFPLTLSRRQECEREGKGGGKESAI